MSSNGCAKRVLIINVNSLLAEVVEGLLTERGRFAVVSVYIDSRATFIQAYEQSKPDVIIIDDAIPVELGRLIASLRYMQEIRLIVLNNRDNKTVIYDKREYNLTNPDQLMNEIC